MQEDVKLRVAEVCSIAVNLVTHEDHDCVRSLRVSEDQSSFVASNEASLEEAEDNPACVPLIILGDGKPVGFAMYALDEEDGNYWIYRLMIDARFQGKGYGRAALRRIIGLIAEQPDCSCVVLGVKPQNERARRLYESAGFRLTGDMIDGEIVLRYEP
ncbi:hypothetical protein N185_33240 [Sinorhizobium sp. GW3]|nr:hypothetical protein N185_33240 [Sinorhizobium sp. GW3]